MSNSWNQHEKKLPIDFIRVTSLHSLYNPIQLSNTSLFSSLSHSSIFVHVHGAVESCDNDQQPTLNSPPSKRRERKINEILMLIGSKMLWILVMLSFCSFTITSFHTTQSNQQNDNNPTNPLKLILCYYCDSIVLHMTGFLKHHNFTEWLSNESNPYKKQS